MVATRKNRYQLGAIRPLVRYVDDDQAVLEATIELAPPTLKAPFDQYQEACDWRRLTINVEVDTDEGFHDEQTLVVDPSQKIHRVRMDFVQPEIWWPAGMGEQSLYRLSVSLYDGDEPLDEHDTDFGLSSIAPASDVLADHSVLRVNGRGCEIDHVIPVDAMDERALLPVGGQSVLLVRGHYGPDLLYEAADRAGVLLVQSVPLAPDGNPVSDMSDHVNRLAAHPSLAGWYVGHLGKLTERLAYCVTSLDPTRAIFRKVSAA